MLSGIGLIIAVALLIFMIVKGVDMITASVITASIILVTSGLNFWEGLLTTFGRRRKLLYPVVSDSGTGRYLW